MDYRYFSCFYIILLLHYSPSLALLDWKKQQNLTYYIFLVRIWIIEEYVKSVAVITLQKQPPHPRPCPVNHADCSFSWKESQTQMSPGAKVGNERSLDIDDRLVLDWGNLENEPCLLRIPQWPNKHIYRLDTAHWPPLSRCALLLMYYF